MMIKTPWIIGLAFLGGVTASSFFWNARMDELRAEQALQKQADEVKHANQIAMLNRQLNEETEKLREKFNDDLTQTVEQKDAAINRIRNSELRLRDKYAKCQKSGGSNGSGTAGRGSETGESAILSGETSEFLVGFASDADKTLAALRACVTQYNQVKFELENSKNEFKD